MNSYRQEMVRWSYPLEASHESDSTGEKGVAAVARLECRTTAVAGPSTFVRSDGLGRHLIRSSKNFGQTGYL